MTLPVETVPLTSLRPHPRNYRAHPADQLEHLRLSLTAYGQYRNIVTANDLTILAGHGVAQAADGILQHVSIVRMPFGPDDPAAIKLLAADNELANRAADDDRALSELLREIAETADDGLLGTGYDEAMLAALVFTTRDVTEVKDENAAAEWAGAGLGEYQPEKDVWRLVITFDSEAERDAFAAQAELGVRIRHKEGRILTGVWPDQPREDLGKLRVEAQDDAA